MKKIIIKEDQKDSLFDGLNDKVNDDLSAEDLDTTDDLDDNTDTNNDIVNDDTNDTDDDDDDDDEEEKLSELYYNQNNISDGEFGELMKNSGYDINSIQTNDDDDDDDYYEYESEEEEQASEELNSVISDFYDSFQNDIDNILLVFKTDDIADKRKDITKFNVKLLGKISRKINNLKFY